MKKFVCLVSVLCLLTALTGCTRTGTQGSNRLKIVATNFPGYDFARAICGTQADMTLLIKPGTESHDFDPTPADIVAVTQCDLFITTGGEGEAWVERLMPQLPEHVKVFRMMDCVTLLEEGLSLQHEHEAREEHDEHAEPDEHVWTSPINAQKIVKALTETVCQLDASHSAVYEASSSSYYEQLTELDKEFRRITTEGQRNLVVFADRFPAQYFIKEYGLECLAAFPGCASQTQPSAATVARLTDEVKQQNIPVVFVIELSNGSLADAVCEQTGARKLLFHSCHNITKAEWESGATYVSLMKQNAIHVRQALS